MSLLDFARGSGLQYALAISALGLCWRLFGIAFLRRGRDLSLPRRSATWRGLRMLVTRLWPRREFLAATGFGVAIGYAFHLGLFVVLFFYVPHVLFWGDLAHRLLHLQLSPVLAWPTLPTGLVSLAAVIALAALCASLIHRFVHPVKRLISSADDYLSWLLTAAPLATGLIAYGHLGGMRYESLLAIHLLTVEALLAYLPWGKLAHVVLVFATRATTGTLFERKGAAL